MRATKYEPLIVRAALAEPPEYVAFFRERLPLIFLCLAQFAVFSVALRTVSFLARRYDRMDVMLPYIFTDIIWLQNHYALVCVAWALLVWGLCVLAKRWRVEAAVVLSTVIHAVAVGCVLVIGALPLAGGVR